MGEQLGKDARFAAIDAGSNGIRLAIAKLNGGGAIRSVHSDRQAVRLGADAFGRGRFTDETLTHAVAAFEQFRHAMQEHEVQRFRAVATSAAREADNAEQLVAAVEQATGIRIEIIDGLTEAQMIFDAVSAYTELRGQLAMLVDMGGGSVELTLARNGRAMASESLRLGPVRLLQKLASRGMKERDVFELAAPFREVVTALMHAELDADESPATCIGTGGNLECLGKLRVPLLGKSKTGKIKLKDLDAIVPKLLEMSVPQRVEQLGLRPDRADVIAIAAVVLQTIMRACGMRKLLTPGIGLKEGLLFRIAEGRVVAPEPTNEPG